MLVLVKVMILNAGLSLPCLKVSIRVIFSKQVFKFLMKKKVSFSIYNRVYVVFLRWGFLGRAWWLNSFEICKSVFYKNLFCFVFKNSSGFDWSHMAL